jgi:hypothetical protein
MLTLTAEVVGRVLQDAVAFRRVVEESTFSSDGTLVDEVQVHPAVLHQRLAAFGGKFVVFGSTLVSAHLLFSVNGDALTIKPTPVIGIEHAF